MLPALLKAHKYFHFYIGILLYFLNFELLLAFIIKVSFMYLNTYFCFKFLFFDLLGFYSITELICFNLFFSFLVYIYKLYQWNPLFLNLRLILIFLYYSSILIMFFYGYTFLILFEFCSFPFHDYH